MGNDNTMVYAARLPEDWKDDTGIKQPKPLWEWNTTERNIPKKFIRRLRVEFKKVLGEVDHMNEDHALIKLDQAIINALLED